MKLGFSLIIFLTVSVAFAAEDFLTKRVASLYKQMPTKFIAELPKSLSFKSQYLNFSKLAGCDAEINPDFRYASYSPLFKRMTVDKQLVALAQECGGEFLHQLDRSIVHEIFHSYDFMAKAEKVDLKGCPTNSKGQLRVKTGECRRKHRDAKKNTAISTTREFYLQAQLHGRNEGDFQGHRSLDPYELKKPQEFAAVNFEAFILDSDYQCRRPSYYKFFAEKFGFYPFKNQVCDHTKLVFSKLNPDLKFDLDPARVYEIQYLHASEGDSIMSGFGHSMLRVIICAPHRKKVDEKCLYDLDHHVVLSYRGEVLESTINPIDGIFGGYSSQLFIFGLKDIIFEYNTTEFRHLFGFPLKLTQQEKEKFLNRTLETFWEYEGSYKFISENCATETYKLIVSSLEDKRGRYKESLTPNGVLEDLIAIGLIDKEYEDPFKLNSLNIFKSKFTYFNIAHKTLFGTELDEDDVLDELESIYQKTVQFVHSQEGATLGRKEKSAAYIIAKRYFDVAFFNYRKKEFRYLKALEESDPEIYQKVKSTMEQTFVGSLKNSYGIPSRAELANAAAMNGVDPNLKTEINNYLLDKMTNENAELLKIYEELKYIKSLETEEQQ